MLLALAAGIIGISIAGCGDGRRDDGTALTATEWRRQANAACRRVGGDLGGLRPLEQDVTGYTTAALPRWRELATELRALRPPSDLEEQAAAYVTQLDYLGTRLLDLYTAAQRQDDERRAAAIELSRAAAVKAGERAGALRLPACAALGIP